MQTQSGKLRPYPEDLSGGCKHRAGGCDLSVTQPHGLQHRAARYHTIWPSRCSAMLHNVYVTAAAPVVCSCSCTYFLWATRGATVSLSAFLACHQCCCAGSSLALGLESSGCCMWHFLKLVARGFLRVLRFPPFLHRFNGSANKIKLK